MNIQSSWTPERVDLLIRLAADKLLASQISDKLKTSKNAIIGKARRLGIKLHGNKHNGHKARVRKRSANQSTRISTPRRVTIRPRRHGSADQPVQIIAAKEIIDLPPDQSSFACNLMELGHNQCRYVLGQATAAALYCAAPAEGSWCGRHHQIIFRPIGARA